MQIAPTDESLQSVVQEQSRTRSRIRWEYAAIALVIVLIAGIRFRLRDMPLERDEGEYAYAGQLILQGIPPYQLAYNMKLPGTYAAYALIMAVFGQTATGIHLGLIVVNAACIFLVFAIAKRIFEPAAAVVAGSTFALLSIRPQLLGLAGHATHFVALAALASIYLLLKAGGTERYWLFFWSGILSGLSLLMKQPGVFFAIFAGLYLLWYENGMQRSRAELFKKFSAFSAGAVIPYALTCLILLRAGVFQRFWFWTVSYARTYGSELTPREGLNQFANRMVLQKEHIGVMWFLIVFGMAAFLWDRRLRPHSVFVLGLLGFSFLAASVGFYYRPHYFIVLYPVLAILAGAGVSAAAGLLRRVKVTKAWAFVPIIVFMLAFANALYADRGTYFTQSPYAAIREIYGVNPFPEAVAIADYIRRNSDQNARIAVLGSEPEIFFYAQRHSATGYIYTYALVEEQSYASVMQSEFIREVEASAPEFIVSVFINQSWLRRSRSDDLIFRWADTYVREHYRLVGIADGGRNHDIYRWGTDTLTYRPRRPEVVVIYRRRE
ncbi:MAG TPA: glycosyltransferase family 39 protein [Candidatus Acidoferrum sp.]|nr:glycosyltransferase family 39 protein [Candidatus Acidoferrum sp.]